MKIPARLFMLLLMIGGGLAGWLIAPYTYPKPIWDKLDIPSKQKDIVEILFVDHNDFEEVQNDIVYVKAESGDVYSILHNEWNLLPSLPNAQYIQKIGVQNGNADSPIVATSNENKFYQLNGTTWELFNEHKEFHWSNEFEQCVTTKEWQDVPPVNTGVIDSAGFVFEHTISGFFKCYVLYDDGHLEAWSRAASSLGTFWIAPFYCVTGIVSGAIFGIILWLYSRNRNKKELS